MARTQIATDNFNRATLDANWSNVGDSTISINSNIQYNNSSFGIFAAARWVGTGTFTDDQYSQTTLSGLTNQGGDQGVGVACRIATATYPNQDYYYGLVYANAASGGTNTVRIGKIINDTDTTLGSPATHVISNGDTVALEVEGQSPNITLRLYINSTLKITVNNDSSLNTGTPGIMCRSGLTNGNYGDSWEGGNLSAGGATPITVATLTDSLAGGELL